MDNITNKLNHIYEELLSIEKEINVIDYARLAARHTISLDGLRKKIIDLKSYINNILDGSESDDCNQI